MKIFQKHFISHIILKAQLWKKYGKHQAFWSIKHVCNLEGERSKKLPTWGIRVSKKEKKWMIPYVCCMFCDRLVEFGCCYLNELIACCYGIRGFTIDKMKCQNQSHNGYHISANDVCDNCSLMKL